jgi:phosphatidylinositol-3-phosphatase
MRNAPKIVLDRGRGLHDNVNRRGGALTTPVRRAARLVAALLIASVAHAGPREMVPRLDHVFVIVLENHNAENSFNRKGILGHPKAPHLNSLARTYNLATNYHGIWHPSLPNYIAMITGDFVGTDVLATGHHYPRGSVVGIGDDDSPANATDLRPPAIRLPHRWRVNQPSIAGQLVAARKDWRAYLQNLPAPGTRIANWPGDERTGNVYAVKHNPFPYIAEVQDNPAERAKQVPLEQLANDLATDHVPALAFIVPDQCHDMHGLVNPLAPCGGADASDDNDIQRGDEMTFLLVNTITRSPVWSSGRNAVFIVFDEGFGPLPCRYDPDSGIDVQVGTLLPGADCYLSTRLNDRLLTIVMTNYGGRGRTDRRLYSHYSLLKTIEAAFDLPLLGHAADASTLTLAPLLAAVPAH